MHIHYRFHHLSMEYFKHCFWIGKFHSRLLHDTGKRCQQNVTFGAWMVYFRHAPGYVCINSHSHKIQGYIPQIHSTCTCLFYIGTPVPFLRTSQCRRGLDRCFQFGISSCTGWNFSRLCMLCRFRKRLYWKISKACSYCHWVDTLYISHSLCK